MVGHYTGFVSLWTPYEGGEFQARKMSGATIATGHFSALVEAAGSASRVRKSTRQDFYERSCQFVVERAVA